MKKREVDQQLLDTLFNVEREWKQKKSIIEQSIEPTDFNFYILGVSQAKYMFMLKEARIRKVSAIRYR